MADKIEWAIRFVHILAAAAWVGGAILWNLVVAPRLLAKGPPAIRKPVVEAIERALPAYFYGVGAITLLAGLLVFTQRYGWAAVADVLKLGSYGRMFVYAGVSGVGMLAIGFFVVQPSLRKLAAELRAPAPDAERARTLGRRLALAGMGIVALGVVAIATMTYAVNLVR